MFDADQLHAYARSYAEAEREACALMCERRAESSGDTGSPSGMARQCARDIRSRKGLT